MIQKPFTVDLVIPIYNEEAALESFHQSLRTVIDELPYNFSIYYVNDGSQDRTQDLLGGLEASDRRVKPIHLSKNFGHQAEISRTRCDFGITQQGNDPIKYGR